MIQTTVKVSGMACSMCEAHINDAIRRAFPVEKVTSSHSKGETVILSETPLDEAAIRETIDATGYTVGEIKAAPYEKKGFFHFGKSNFGIYPTACFASVWVDLYTFHIGGKNYGYEKSWFVCCRRTVRHCGH